MQSFADELSEIQQQVTAVTNSARLELQLPSAVLSERACQRRRFGFPCSLRKQRRMRVRGGRSNGISRFDCAQMSDVELEFSRTLRQLHEIVSRRSSVPKEAVYPKFRILAR